MPKGKELPNAMALSEHLERVQRVKGPDDGSHDWRWDEVFTVFRCNRCLVRGDKAHEPICPKAAPPVR